MKKYLSLCVLYFKDMSAYKADVVLSMIINSAFFIISFVVWNAVFTGGGLTEINNYSLSSTITYFLVGTIIFRMDFAEQIMLTEWIWSGDLVKDLVKPWNIKFVQFIMYVSNIFYSLVMYVPVLIILFLFFHNYVILPNLLYFIYFIITVGLITILGLVFFGVLHCLTFFTGINLAKLV